MRQAESGSGKVVAIMALLLVIAAGAAYYYLSYTPDSEDSPVEAVEAPPETAPEPEPEPEPAPRVDLPSTGEIRVSANVENAIVYIDGESMGPAPYENDAIAIGRYEVRVTREGYEDFVESLRVRGGRMAELHARLSKLPPSLRIVSDVPGATVFLDRNYVGTTPVRIDAVDPGDHQLTVSAEGYEMHAETVTVTEGHRDINVRFQRTATSLNESVAVVHKHRFGSCEGRLIADSSGIRYVTNDDDAFHVSFDVLERFEVDYIEKNLNLKIRGGRNYNFTEPSGNADALFVFHKNVQAFREGL